MSVMDSFLKAMKLDANDDPDFIEDDVRDSRYDRYGDYDDEDEDDEPDEPVRQSRTRQSTPSQGRERSPYREQAQIERIDERQRRNQGGGSQQSMNTQPRQVQNTNNRQRRGSMDNMEICSIKPTSMEDTREVTDTLLQNRPVILNLEGIDVEVAQRIVDFVSGSCYAIRGNLQKISRYIFIITPANVDVSGDFLEIVGGGLGRD